MVELSELQAKKPEAIEWMVNTYSDRMLKAATLVLADSHLAEDVVQESLIDAVNHISGFRGEASLYTWLYKILMRRCQRHQKNYWNRIKVVPKDVLGYLIAVQAEAEHNKLELEKQWKIRDAISCLPYAYREIITLFYYEDFSIKEIATILNAPLGTVKNRLYRARLKLAEHLGKEKDDEL